MAKLFCIFVACISVVMLTSCSAHIEYNWSTGLSLSEFTESSPELIEKITSDNTIAENNGTAYDGGRLPACELSAKNMPISDKAQEYFYNSFQQLFERWSESDIDYGSVLSDLEAVSMVTKEFYPIVDGAFGVYGLGLRTSPNPEYYEVYHITEKGNCLIYSETHEDMSLLCDGDASLYFLHDNGILTRLDCDGTVTELYDARVRLGGEKGEYAETSLRTSIQGEEEKIVFSLEFVSFDSSEEIMLFREDEVVYDVCKNELVSRKCGEFVPSTL